MFTPQTLTPLPFDKITQLTHDEHMKLYHGYVKNANGVLEKIPALVADDTKVYELGELYRRFAFEYNGMRNHELYFALLTKSAGKGIREAAPTIGTAIVDQWGTIEAWRTAFDAMAVTRGIGWAFLSYDPQANILINHWVDEQHLGQLQGTVPLIAIDFWEHAYVADYQPSGKKQYLTDFFFAMNWEHVEALYTTLKRTP